MLTCPSVAAECKAQLSRMHVALLLCHPVFRTARTTLYRIGYL